jgi:hypothetical protein
MSQQTVFLFLQKLQLEERLVPGIIMVKNSNGFGDSLASKFVSVDDETEAEINAYSKTLNDDEQKFLVRVVGKRADLFKPSPEDLIPQVPEMEVGGNKNNPLKSSSDVTSHPSGTVTRAWARLFGRTKAYFGKTPKGKGGA